MPRAGGYGSEQDTQDRERDTKQGNGGAGVFLVASSVEQKGGEEVLRRGVLQIKSSLRT